jgi:(2S)-methylsuccinyl-CoA dehydrogenase
MMHSARHENQFKPVQSLKEMRNAVLSARFYLNEIRTYILAAKTPMESQFIRHGFSWASAYVETLAAMLEWVELLDSENRLKRLELLIASALFSEYLAQLQHGIAMSQDEIIRPAHMSAGKAAEQFAADPAVIVFADYSIANLASDIVNECLECQAYGDNGLDDTQNMIAEQIHDFVQKEVTPFAHGWHLKDCLIPDDVLLKLADMGVFGLTISTEYGGTGLGKLAMCIVTEELSRGYIGVGSLGTRSEIAGELIQIAGTQAQKDKYLPAIASGEILPVAVFTEPDTGSDLASISTRARLERNDYVITGNKTWITHAGRSDLMTLLVRTNSEEKGHRGLTMFLAEKSRGSSENPFPDADITGSEIGVLGYRGMKEYDMAFDGYRIPQSAVLGGVENQGFRQLMQTFESARIQTAARALGVGVNAMELAFEYAQNRKQFGKPIISFERVYGKLARMVVEIMGVRQLSYMAARKKDQGGRCDVEAGMAKLLAARLSWSAADNAVQIHGGIGYALETPISRILCDARILNIFEGAAEIQAEIIARGLLSRD